MNKPAVLVVHPGQNTAEELALVLQDYGFHALPVTNAVDALEHVENLDFDVAVVSSEMPSELPQLLLDSIGWGGLHGCNWLEILVLNSWSGWHVEDFVRAVSEAVKERRWTCWMIAMAWRDAWDGEAGYEPGSSWVTKLTDAEFDAELERIFATPKPAET